MEIRRSLTAVETGTAAHFSGKVEIQPIATLRQPGRIHALEVRLSAGAGTHSHRHPFGQALQVLEGEGHVQTRGGPLESICAGDTVIASAGEWHWHGATETSAMAHLALQEADESGATAEWGHPVDDRVARSKGTAPPAG